MQVLPKPDFDTKNDVKRVRVIKNQ